MQNDSLELLNYPLDKNQNIKDIRLELTYSSQNKYHNMTTNKTDSRNITFYVNNTNIGPFEASDEEIKTFLDNVDEIIFFYKFNTYIPYLMNSYECYSWVISSLKNSRKLNKNMITNTEHIFKQLLKFIVKIVKVIFGYYLFLDITNENKYLSQFLRKEGWLHFFVFIFAILCFFMNLIHIYKKLRNINLLNRLNKKVINIHSKHFHLENKIKN